jgi:hypothetical protein
MSLIFPAFFTCDSIKLLKRCLFRSLAPNLDISPRHVLLSMTMG